jgi:hypothetical protein
VVSPQHIVASPDRRHTDGRWIDGVGADLLTASNTADDHMGLAWRRAARRPCRTRGRLRPHGGRRPGLEPAHVMPVLAVSSTGDDWSAFGFRGSANAPAARWLFLRFLDPDTNESLGRRGRSEADWPVACNGPPEALGAGQRRRLWRHRRHQGQVSPDLLKVAPLRRRPDQVKYLSPGRPAASETP